MFAFVFSLGLGLRFCGWVCFFVYFFVCVCSCVFCMVVFVFMFSFAFVFAMYYACVFFFVCFDFGWSWLGLIRKAIYFLNPGNAGYLLLTKHTSHNPLHIGFSQRPVLGLAGPASYYTKACYQNVFLN
jgi:hypothetical protein